MLRNGSGRSRERLDGLQSFQAKDKVVDLGGHVDLRVGESSNGVFDTVYVGL